MEKREKKILGGLSLVSLIATCGCVSYAGKNADGYWSTFDSKDGARTSLSSGFLVVEAAGSEAFGIGPFRGNGPSIAEEDVVLDEEKEEEAAPGRLLLSEDIHWREVTLSAGDTLSKLAEEAGVLMKDIAAANEITDEHKLRAGQTIYIPASSDYVLETLGYVKRLKDEDIARRKKASVVRSTFYVVKEGDSLWSIANAFDLDVNTLFGCNKVSETNVLKVGATIRVPNQDGIFIKVKSGQTLDKLAKEYGIYSEAILSANDMAEGVVLAKGSELFLPGAKAPTLEAPSTSPKSARVQNDASVGNTRSFGWPVVGKISSPYGWRRDPVRGGRDMHTGLDIRAPYGRQIVAAASGTVVYSGWMGGYGKTVVISHPGNTTTLYGHCSKLLVTKGQKIQRGSRIALVGSTGRSTGNHLHFEIRRGGVLVNPLKQLR